MRTLFDPTNLNGMTLRNRTIRSATYEGLADNDGACTEAMTDLVSHVAEGGIGLLITGYAFVSPEGRGLPRQMGLHSDAMIAPLRAMADAVHAHGGKLVVQIAHSGAETLTQITGYEPLGPSAIDPGPSILRRTPGVACREMTQADIHRVVVAFGAAAARAQQAACDGVQIHSAHGYLLNQFLSPHYNKRLDGYGGSLENRARFLREVVDETHRVTGPAFPILVKINSDDFLEDGFTPEEMTVVCKMLEEHGVDAIELSGTTLTGKIAGPIRKGNPETEADEVYYRHAGRLYKEHVAVPLIHVGGIRSYSVAQELVETGEADYVAFSRPLIREPNLVARWQSGDRSRSKCISCNECTGPLHHGLGIKCIFH